MLMHGMYHALLNASVVMTGVFFCLFAKVSEDELNSNKSGKASKL